MGCQRTEPWERHIQSCSMTTRNVLPVTITESSTSRRESPTKLCLARRNVSRGSGCWTVDKCRYARNVSASLPSNRLARFASPSPVAVPLTPIAKLGGNLTKMPPKLLTAAPDVGYRPNSPASHLICPPSLLIYPRRVLTRASDSGRKKAVQTGNPMYNSHHE